MGRGFTRRGQRGWTPCATLSPVTRSRVFAAFLSPLALALLVVPVATSPAALATPGTGVEADTTSHTTEDGVDYVVRRITIAPGGSTGWHFHDGQVYGVITEGTLTHYSADCSVDGVYGLDAPIAEESGPEHVHVGRNEGDVPLVMWVTYITADDNPVDGAAPPLSRDVPNPGCSFE